MKTESCRRTSCVLVAFLCCFLLADSAANAQAFDFNASWQGWQQQWHKDDLAGSDGTVSLDPTLGVDDNWSLMFDMGDGGGDDGTLWVERAFPTPTAAPVLVDVDFELFSQEQSDVSQFEVKAFIGALDPSVQADFITIGSTDTIAGWAPYRYQRIVEPLDGLVWVAVGVRVAFEGPRDYWIDNVTVSVPEPSGATLLALATFGLLMLRRITSLATVHRRS